jgi:putative transposase
VPRARGQQRNVLQVEGQVGLDVSDAKRLRGLEDENTKLKKLLAEAMLDNAMPRRSLQKNGDARRQAKGRRSVSGRV